MAKKIERIDPQERAAVQLVGDVYNKIADIAEEEERTMGGQVAYMLKTNCTHPLKSREEVVMVAAPVFGAVNNKPARVGKNQPVHGFVCHQCGVYVPTNPLGTDEFSATDIADALNAKLIGIVK